MSSAQFRQTIKQLREEMGWSVQEASERIGVSASYMYNLESQQDLFTDELLNKIITAFTVPPVTEEEMRDYLIKVLVAPHTEPPRLLDTIKKHTREEQYNVRLDSFKDALGKVNRKALEKFLNYQISVLVKVNQTDRLKIQSYETRNVGTKIEIRDMKRYIKLRKTWIEFYLMIREYYLGIY